MFCTVDFRKRDYRGREKLWCAIDKYDGGFGLWNRQKIQEGCPVFCLAEARFWHCANGDRGGVRPFYIHC
jgi:hypothetical protein